MTHSATNAAARELLPCRTCGCPFGLELDSSSAAEASWIECHNCQHRMQAKCDEETLAERWNKLSRKGMPFYDVAACDDVPPGSLNSPREIPVQEVSLRRSLDYWYARAKAAESTLTPQQGGEQEAGDVMEHVANLAYLKVGYHVDIEARNATYDAAMSALLRSKQAAPSEGDGPNGWNAVMHALDECDPTWRVGGGPLRGLAVEAIRRLHAANTSKQAAGEAVSDDAIDVALHAWNRARYEWSRAHPDTRDEPQARVAMRAVIAAFTTPPRHPAEVVRRLDRVIERGVDTWVIGDVWQLLQDSAEALRK